uniref:NADH-ubiquinone oxidoreductase chain 4 n=1 Tax=Neelus murinus TaxID=1348065 RepID=A0A6B9INQ9_9HEXA|nr:NADH dehydrogenase subunit 4 [Neelus murinus]
MMGLVFLIMAIFPILSMGIRTCVWWGSMLLGVLITGVLFFMGPVYLNEVGVGGGFLLGGLNFSLGILSCWLLVLTVGAMVGLVSSLFFESEFLMIASGLTLVLIFSFFTGDLLSFYFFFEASLIPTLIMIFGWGSQPERLQAGLYFLFYTLIASLPLLLGILWVSEGMGGTSFNLCGTMSMLGGAWFIVMNFAFLVKAPMFLVHVWLPKAHVEAPVAGSMVLAGILLKLGGYGMYSVVGLMSVGYLNFGCYVFGLSLVGMVLVGFMSCRTIDLKSLVAYSSVAHMGVVVSGVISMYVWGITGSLVMMVALGVTSSGMFYLVNLMYERSGSRMLFMNSGVLSSGPIISVLIFLILISNFSAPPSLNLLGEIYLISVVFKYSVGNLLFLALGCFLGAVFTLHMYSYTQHGEVFSISRGMMDVNILELNMLFMHIIPINFFILFLGSYFF